MRYSCSKIVAKCNLIVAKVWDGKAEKLRSEFVVAITGEVAMRAGAVNQNLETGDIEIIAKDIRILSEVETPPSFLSSNKINLINLLLFCNFEPMGLCIKTQAKI